MSDSVDILKKLALQVRNASAEGENTAERIGRIFIGILENTDNSDIEKLTKYFLRKDKEDSTNFLLSLLGGTVIKKYAKFGDFVTGVSGGYIDEKGNLEMESGVFRKRLSVPEIAYNRTAYFKGPMVNSPGGGCTVLSYADNGDGTYTIAPGLTDADGLSQFVDDILTACFVTKNSEGKLNGFEEMKFRVTAADYTAKKFTVIPRPGHSDWKPAGQMAYMYGEEFCGLLAEKTEEANHKRSTSMRSHLWGHHKKK